MQKEVLLLISGIFALAMVFAVSEIAAQSEPKEITKQEYLMPRRTSFEKTRGLPYRRTVKSSVFENGKLASSTEWFYEWISKDRSRMVLTETTGERRTNIEQIDVEGKKYCRKNNGSWEIPKTYCIPGSGSGGPSNISEIKYSVQNDATDPKIRIYRDYIVYKNVWSPTKEKEGLSFWESSYWVNQDGIVIREETRRGLVDSRQIQSVQTTVSEYNPKDLKIDMPM